VLPSAGGGESWFGVADTFVDLFEACFI